jgi:hypothetical protein
MLDGLERRNNRQTRRLVRATPLDRRQAGEIELVHCSSFEWSRSIQHRLRLDPVVQAGAADADAGDRQPLHWPSPNTRLQLLPPKPNELLIT